MSGYPYASVGSFVVPPVLYGLDDSYVPSRDAIHRYDDIVCPGVLGQSRGSGQGFTHVPRTHEWTDSDGSSDTSDDDIDDWGPVPEWLKGSPPAWAGIRRSIIMQQEGQVLGASHLIRIEAVTGAVIEAALLALDMAAATEVAFLALDMAAAIGADWAQVTMAVDTPFKAISKATVQANEEVSMEVVMG